MTFACTMKSGRVSANRASDGSTAQEVSVEIGVAGRPHIFQKTVSL